MSNAKPAGSGRSDDYRYTVDENGAEITPLAHVEAFIGNARVRILNISMGGMALLFDEAPKIGKDDILDISVSIRERAFPVKIEVKGVRSLRVSCAFMNPSRMFLGALREFLKPKFLGVSLERNPALSGREDILHLVADASHYDAYLGQNQTACFVWTTHDRKLLRMVLVAQDLIFEWSEEKGLRTGRLDHRSAFFELSAAGEDGINWDRAPDATLLHYFADILLAWLSPEVGSTFVEKLFGEEDFNKPLSNEESELPLRFPLG